MAFHCLEGQTFANIDRAQCCVNEVCDRELSGTMLARQVVQRGQAPYTTLDPLPSYQKIGFLRSTQSVQRSQRVEDVFCRPLEPVKNHEKRLGPNRRAALRVAATVPARQNVLVDEVEEMGQVLQGLCRGVVRSRLLGKSTDCLHLLGKTGDAAFKNQQTARVALQRVSPVGKLALGGRVKTRQDAPLRQRQNIQEPQSPLRFPSVQTDVRRLRVEAHRFAHCQRFAKPHPGTPIMAQFVQYAKHDE